MLDFIGLILSFVLICRIIAWAFPAESEDDVFRRFKEAFEHRTLN